MFASGNETEITKLFPVCNHTTDSFNDKLQDTADCLFKFTLGCFQFIQFSPVFMFCSIFQATSDQMFSQFFTLKAYCLHPGFIQYNEEIAWLLKVTPILLSGEHVVH